jgi:superfamily II DNA helicase RecQ
MPRTKGSWRRYRHADLNDTEIRDSTPSSWDELNPTSSGELPNESNFYESIPFIHEMDVAQIQAMVKLACIVPVKDAQVKTMAADESKLSMQAMVEAYEVKERVIERALLAIFGYESIKPIQLRVIVRQLPSEIPKDTLLVARTGFGKSMTFQAFAPLTGMVAIQVIPLSKLGEEQAVAMSKLRGAKPVLITAQTRLAEPNLYQKIQEGRYNHILLGPEQLLMPEFLNVLKSIQQRVGLVAIDECHTIGMWGQGFRQFYTQRLH